MIKNVFRLLKKETQRIKKTRMGIACSSSFKSFEQELRICGENKFNFPTVRKLLIEESGSERKGRFRRLLSRKILSQYHRKDVFGNNHKKDKIKYLVGEKVYILRFMNQ